MSRQLRLQYDSKIMGLALSQVKSGMSIQKAAKLYGVPRSTLGDKVRGVVPEVGKSGPGTVLTSWEEDMLVNHIKAMAAVGLPLTKKDLLHEVKRLLDEDNRETKFTNNLPGNGCSKSLCLHRFEKYGQ